MDSPELLYQIAFASLKGVNQRAASSILAAAGSEQRFFELSSSQLTLLFGRDMKIFDRAYRDLLLEKARREVDFVCSTAVKAHYFTSPDYPSRLLEAEDAPLMLFTLGNCDLNATRMIAIVGTRNATPYGREFIARLTEDLAKKLNTKAVIVSGLALGIDAMAHASAMRSGLPTVGVLAHGLNTIYPSQNRQLAAEIVRGDGALVTEYGSAAVIHKGNFLARNRIVAAMTDCTVVVESADKGGALVTARLASGYNRDVFALPGRTSDRYSAGCNGLIACNVASLVRDADDLISHMNWPIIVTDANQPSLFEELTCEEQAVVDLLQQRGEATVNQISISLNVPVGRLISTLVDMEFKSLLLSYPGGKYRLA